VTIAAVETAPMINLETMEIPEEATDPAATFAETASQSSGLTGTS